ncbi:MAG: amidohydrolase [Acidimicrobiaceae bacterium]|nr:amidohydrolase [Acidimicrobiaceae bacterium]
MGTSSPTSSPATSVLSGLQTVRGWATEFYRDLHAHPELSHQEHATASKVAERLRASGIEVHSEVGGTGVVGIVRNGEGPKVLLRADMDALPIAEATGLDYASHATATDGDGNEVSVMHACGHDMHVACLLGVAHLLATARDVWVGTLIALFQPAEETGDGARSMLDANLAKVIPTPDVALAQHVLPAPSGLVGTNAGPTLSASDSMRITLHGRGAHGSMPQASVDPVVLAALVVVRLQTVVARETSPGERVVVTVGSIQAGTKSNVIPDHAVIELNIRTYSEQTRTSVLDAIRRIVDAECQASGCPKPADFELIDRFPLTDNDPDTTAKVAAAFASYFGERSRPLPMQTASEDFSDIPNAFGVPYCYWGIGGIDPDTDRKAELQGRVAQDIPVNHSAYFAPVIQPTLDTGIEAMVVAALASLGKPDSIDVPQGQT